MYKSVGLDTYIIVFADPKTSSIEMHIFVTTNILSFLFLISKYKFVEEKMVSLISQKLSVSLQNLSVSLLIFSTHCFTVTLTIKEMINVIQ